MFNNQIVCATCAFKAFKVETNYHNQKFHDHDIITLRTLYFSFYFKKELTNDDSDARNRMTVSYYHHINYLSSFGKQKVSTKDFLRRTHKS